MSAIVLATHVVLLVTGADPVVVLSESAARRFFGRAAAAGRTLEVYPIAVAGVVGDVRYRGFREPPAETAYYALAQYPVNGVHLLVDGVGDFVPSASAGAAAVYDVEPGLVLGEVRVVGEPGPGDIGVPTAEAFLVAVLAGFAVLQMLVALYGAAAYSAVRRRPEYALRAALGAAPVRLVTAALRESLLQTVLGLLAGAGLTAAAARVLPAVVSAPGFTSPAFPRIWRPPRLLPRLRRGRLWRRCAAFCGSIQPRFSALVDSGTFRFRVVCGRGRDPRRGATAP